MISAVLVNVNELMINEHWANLMDQTPAQKIVITLMLRNLGYKSSIGNL